MPIVFVGFGGLRPGAVRLELDVEEGCGGRRGKAGMESELRLPSALECFRSGEEECRGAFAVPREVVVAVDAPAVVETDVHAGS